MIGKDKMFIIASDLDDSIKRQATLYEITLFKSFVTFEAYVNSVPVTVDTIVISSKDFAFNANNMLRIKNTLDSPFLKLSGNVLYLIDKSYDIDLVNKFFQDRKFDNWAVYQGDLSQKFITDIVTGEMRQTEEVQNEVITYRVRASEYLKAQENAQNQAEDSYNKYFTDDDIFESVDAVEEPQYIQPQGLIETNISYVIGDTLERTVLAFLIAQYRALSGKTILVEQDWEYHTLTDIVTKSDIKCELFYVEDLMDDVGATLRKIQDSTENLVVLGCRKRKKYDYNFVMDILESNLNEKVMFIVRECTFTETPYGRNYTVAMPNTVPEVLRACNMLKYKPNKRHAVFVGVQLSDMGPVNISSTELASVLSSVLEINGINAVTVRIKGTKLKGEDVVYDILSIINKGNKR